MPAGRPTDYRPEYVEQVEKLCALGATDVELADFFEVGLATVRRWATVHPEFRAAMKVGKAEADDRVERSLYHRAMGYTFESEKIFQHQGQIVRTSTVEHVPPDTVAAQFWLKNRRSQDWKDRQELTGKDGGPIETKTSFSFEDLTAEQRAAAKLLLDALAEGPSGQPEGAGSP